VHLQTALGQTGLGGPGPIAGASAGGTLVNDCILTVPNAERYKGHAH
jgi:hypothetical protein